MNNLTALGRSISSYNLLSPDKINQLKSRLQIGQLIKGRVIDILPGDKYLFRIQGLNLIAKSAVMFKIGTVVFAYILEISPKLVLKWAKGKNEKVRLKKGLKNLGIEGNRSNMLMAEAILDSDLPLSLGLFNYITESISAELDSNESKEAIQETIKQIISDPGMTGKSSLDPPKIQESNPVSRIHNNLQIFAGQFSLSELQDDVNTRQIKEFMRYWKSLPDINEPTKFSDLLSRFGIRHETELSKNLKNGRGNNRSLKSALIGFTSRLRTLHNKGYKISILNKLLSSADNIIREIDALVLDDNKGLSIISLFPPTSSNDGGTLVWKRKQKIVDEDNWSLKIEMNLEPLGHAEVNIIKNSNNVKLEFNLKNQLSRNLISDNYEVLEKKLEQLNFRVDKVKLKVVGQ